MICLLLGVAFAVSTLSIIAHPSYGDDGLAPTLGAVATAFMLCSFRPVAAEAKDTPLEPPHRGITRKIPRTHVCSISILSSAVFATSALGIPILRPDRSEFYLLSSDMIAALDFGQSGETTPY